MATIEQIRRVTVRGDSQGLDKLTADLNNVAVAQTKVASSSGTMSAATKSATGTVINAQREFDRLSRSVDPVAKAQAALERGMRLSAAAISANAGAAEQAQRTLQILRQRLDDARTAQNSTAQSTGLMRGGMTQLSFQLNDVATMLASGSSPFQVLATQGGQVYQVLQQGPQGVWGSIKGVAGALAGMVTPARLAGGALAAAAVAGVIAWNAYDDKLKAVQTSLNGLGRGVGLTSSQLVGLGTAGAANGKQSFANAMAGAGTFAGAGVYGSAISGLIPASRQFSGAYGLSLGDAQQQLAKIFADPASGVRDLSKLMGDFGVQLEQDLVRLQATNRMEEAQQRLLAAFQERLKATTDQTGYFGRAMEATGAFFSSIAASIGRIGAQQDPAFQVSTARRNLSMATSLGAGPDKIAELQEKLNAALGKVESENKKAADARAAAEAERATRIQRENDIIRQSSDVASASVLARTAAERLAIEQERIRIEVVKDASRAATQAAEAERARTTAVAEATRALRDYKRTAADEAFTMGARNEREQFIRRMQLENRDLGERTNVLPDSQRPSFLQRTSATDPNAWYALDKFTNRVEPQPIAPLGPFGRFPNGISGAQRDEVVRRLEEIGLERYVGQVPSAASGPAMARAPRTLDITKAPALRGFENNAPGRADEGRLAAWDENKFSQMMHDAGVAIEANRRALEVNARTFSMSTAEVARQTEQVRLENEVIRTGIPLTDERRAAIAKLAEAEGQLAAAREKVAESQKRTIDTLDMTRSTFSDALSSPLKALARGEKPGDALRQVGQRGLDKLIDSSAGLVTSGLFGGMGKAGGGLFGDLLGSLIGGKQNTAMMNVSAAVVNVGGPGAALGATSGGSGGFFSSIFSSFFGGGSGAEAVASAKGNVFAGGAVIPFSKGGVFASPVMFPMAGGKTGIMAEAGEEAVMPLQRGRDGRLGVSAAGASGGGGKATVNVHNYGSSQVRTEDRGESPDGSRMIDIIVEEKVSAMFASGRADGFMGARFGSRPQKVFR